MEVVGGLVIAAFVIFIANRLGYVSFHKPVDKPRSGGSGGGSRGGSGGEAKIK